MAVVPVMMAIAAVVSAVGAIQQGQAAKKAANFNATVNLQNAQIAQSNAEAAAKQHERETYLRLGSIHANQGKAGGAAGEGSVLDVLGDVAAQRELERQNIFYNAQLQARGFQNTAALDTFSGKQAQTASYFKAGSSLLSAAGSMAGGAGGAAGGAGGPTSALNSYGLTRVG